MEYLSTNVWFLYYKHLGSIAPFDHTHDGFTKWKGTCFQGFINLGR